MLLRLLFLLCLNLLPDAVLAQQSETSKVAGVPESCPVTRPYQGTLFVPPAPYAGKAGNGRFWFGTDRLWTGLPANGMLKGLGADRSAMHTTFSEKLFWWRQGYDARMERQPKLKVTGKRMDASAPPLKVSRATNAGVEGRSAMLVGVGFPTLGCWQITGRYEEDELTFVIWLAR